jgi:hypothetical protein
MKTGKYSIFRGTLSLVFETGFMVSLTVNLLSTLSTYGALLKILQRLRKLFQIKWTVV